MTPISFYKGVVSHIRVKGLRHARRHHLRYRIAYVLVDIDRFADADRHSRFLGVGKPGIMSVIARDHGDGKTQDLSSWVRAKAESHGVKEECARIALLTLPRMFGYVFNPISIYFLYDREGRLHHILYEVNNTFGGRHFYFTKPDPAHPQMRHHAEKELYVSPFFDVNGGYEFSVGPPDEKLFLNIDYHDAHGEKALNARLEGARRPVTDGQSLKILAEFPLMTLGVVMAIHWEALKLFVKGARFRAEPNQKETKGAVNSLAVNIARSKRRTT